MNLRKQELANKKLLQVIQGEANAIVIMNNVNLIVCRSPRLFSLEFMSTKTRTVSALLAEMLKQSNSLGLQTLNKATYFFIVTRTAATSR